MNEKKLACIHCNNTAWTIVRDKTGRFLLICGGADCRHGCNSSVPALVVISPPFWSQVEYVERITGPQG